MMADHHERLASAVRQRRAELNVSQEEMAARCGLSHVTLRLVEFGSRQSFRSPTLAGIDKGLEWEPGSAQAIVNGGAAPSAQTAELTYWRAEAHYWREEAQRLRNVLGEIERATAARRMDPVPPQPPVGVEVTTDRGRFVRAVDGWHCTRPDCTNCPCIWDEVVDWGGVTSAVVEFPATSDRTT